MQRNRPGRSKFTLGGLAASLLICLIALCTAFGQASPKAGSRGAARRDGPRTMNHRPSSIAHRPTSKDGRRPSSIVHRPSSKEGGRFFVEAVRPILESRCLTCHSGEKPQAGLRLTGRASVLKGGVSGPAVSLRKPAESLLVAAVNYRGRRMPPTGKLPAKEIEVLARWVAMGLPWPAGEHASLEKTHRLRPGPPKVTPEAMRFWSFQRVRRPEPPPVKARAWVRSPIDAFVLRKLEAAGLAPNPPASRTALLRRGSYDLTGLPPTPEEVRAFLADASPQAWERVVDRLLASPRYGEKWARHWLDLVRFAESNSYERDGTKPNAWRYRDYVISAFNEDKPYNEFILEQLAGDELAPRTPERLVATGYHRLGIWDDEPVDPEQAHYDDLDDIASTTSQVFLGLTIGCARCHDHKLDPLPQVDYYRFLAFFNGIRRYGVRAPETVAAASLRPIAPEAEVRKQRAEIAAHMARVQANQGGIDALENRVLADLIPVEKEEWRTENARLPIVRKRVPRVLSQKEFDRYHELLEERRGLRRFQPSALDMALCVTEVGPKARDTHVLGRGNPHAKGDKVEPAFPAVLSPPVPSIEIPSHGESCGRRLALARWIAGPENPLTARVMANRIWQYHFGRGIVRSPNNFGFQGDKPTHPELLDWLASELVASGWRLKPLHRQIMLSSAYRMSSRARPAKAGTLAALAKDPENDLFWRFDMRRLAAEELRDSVLAVNGSLNLKMGGPGIYPTIPPEVLAGQSRPGENWGNSPPEEQRRRSIYIFVKRSLAYPLISSFDGPETDLTCPVRFSTTQPTQALGMLNSGWINEQARVFADTLQKAVGDDQRAQVSLALSRVLQREPAPGEIERGARFIESLRQEEALGAREALTAFCVLALNLNEFVYLD